MHRRFRTSTAPIVLILGAFAVLGLVTACGGGGQSDQQSERSGRLAELREQKEALDEARQELAELEERLERVESGEPVEPAGDAEGAQGEAEGEMTEAEGEMIEPEEVDVEALRAEIENKDADITEMAEQLNADLVAFINEDPPVQGEPIPEVVQEAFALKAEEDMTLAQEYITEGGNYGRAISMYEDTLRMPLPAPLEQEVQAALERAQELRYMDEERFSQVEDGMTQEEVRNVLGTVNPRNRRDFPEREVLAWFYPKNQEGEAAAVWFRKQGEDWEVYRTDFDAVTKEEAEEG